MDAGLRSLKIIHKLLMIDEEWTTRTPRQFTWLGWRLAQSVEAGEPCISRDLEVSRIVASVRVVEEVGLPAHEVHGLLGSLNVLAVGGALLYSESERAVDAVLAATIHEETVDWRAQQVGSNLIILLALLEHAADNLADRLRGRVAVRTGPGQVLREVPDDMLNVLHDHYRPAGLEPSRFASMEEIRTIEEEVRGGPFFSAGGDAGGIAIEVPFGEDETTLIQIVAEEPHPYLGSGLGIFTSVRVYGTIQEIGLHAMSLNLRQLRHHELPPGLGAWCAKTRGEKVHLAHAQFIPNAAFRPGLALDAAILAISRALWVDGLFFPGAGDRSAVEILSRQLSRGSGRGLN